MNVKEFSILVHFPYEIGGNLNFLSNPYNRAMFVQALKAEGVTACTRAYNRPLYKEVAFEDANLRSLLHESITLPDYQSMNLPNAERWAASTVTISQRYLVGDQRGANYIIEAICKIKQIQSK